MKKVIVLASFLFGFTSIVNAQEIEKKENHEKKEAHDKKGVHEKKIVNTPEQRAQKSVDALNNEVTLTEEQKVKIKGLALSRVAKVDEIKAKYKGQPENKEVAKKEIHAVLKEYRENAKLVLTAEQLEKMKAKHKEMKAKGKENSLDAND
jgi:hypothetical protein